MKNFKRELILLAVIFFTFACLAETRDRVVVFDTGIQINEYSKRYLCADGHADFTNTGIDDRVGHGTNIAGLIARGMNTGTQCITVIKYYNTVENPYNDLHPNVVLETAWKHLLTLNARYVNMSFVGEQFILEEYKTLKQLIEQGVKVAVAAGNEGLNLDLKCDRYPACYKFSKNFYVVGAHDLSMSNYGSVVNVLEAGVSQRGMFGPMMSGSSQATANWMAKLVKENQ